MQCYLFIVNNGNTRAMCEISLKLTKKSPERRQSRCSGVIIINLEKISHINSLENARIKPRSWRSVYSKKFEFWTTRYDLDGDLFPFSCLRRLQNNNASDSLKVFYRILILTVCCVIVRRKNLYFLITMTVWYHCISLKKIMKTHMQTKYSSCKRSCKEVK